MAMVDVVSSILVQRSAAIWRCSAFITWTGWTLTMTAP